MGCGEKYLSLPGELITCKRMRFLGNIEAKIDSKGRVFLPAAFRKELQSAGEESLVVRKDVFQPCLVLYPESVWNRQMDILRSRLNRWDKRHQSVMRQFVSDAETVTLDANGRMMLGRRHLKMAGAAQAVRFIGMDDVIEIWSAELAEGPFMSQEEFGAALESIMRQNADGTAAERAASPGDNK